MAMLHQWTSSSEWLDQKVLWALELTKVNHAPVHGSVYGGTPMVRYSQSPCVLWFLVSLVGLVKSSCHPKFVCLFVCLDDLPIKGTRETPTRGYEHQAGNSQSLSYKHWFNVYDYELHKSRNCDLVIVKSAVYLEIWTNNLVIASPLWFAASRPTATILF